MSGDLVDIFIAAELLVEHDIREPFEGGLGLELVQVVGMEL